MNSRRLLPALFPALLAVALGACGGPPETPTWDARLPPALCSRAEELLADGNLDGARAAASRALEHARAVGDPASEARARHVLGLLDGSQEELGAALALLDSVPDDDALAAQRLVLAELALRNGAPESARALVGSVLERTGDWEEPVPRARVEAWASHLMAVILRDDGRRDEAYKRERWASLQLTVLPNAEALALKRSVAQALGDDLAARAEFDEAYREHAKAAALAAELEDREALLHASRCVGRDLVLMDRLGDAVLHFGRTLDVARELDDWDVVEDVALEALHWLDRRGEPWDSRYRRVFRDTLDEVTARRRSTPAGG